MAWDVDPPGVFRRQSVDSWNGRFLSVVLFAVDQVKKKERAIGHKPAKTLQQNFMANLISTAAFFQPVGQSTIPGIN